MFGADWEHFNRYVKKNRHLLDEQTQTFLSELKNTATSRATTFRKGTVLWRAQLGHGWKTHVEYSRLLHSKVRLKVPHSKQRMTPLSDGALEGRLNSKGIPCLYLATDQQTAMSEVRPWVGSYISLARFRLARKVTLVNLSLEEKVPWDDPDADFEAGMEKAIWGDIQDAFSRPVTPSDNVADYVHTQVLAELFRQSGYDGVMYRSSLGKSGINVALFSLRHATFVDAVLHRAKSMGFRFEQEH